MEPKRFAVWAVYGTREGKCNQRLREFPYREREQAEAYAKNVPGSYLALEKVEK